MPETFRSLRRGYFFGHPERYGNQCYSWKSAGSSQAGAVGRAGPAGHRRQSVLAAEGNAAARTFHPVYEPRLKRSFSVPLTPDVACVENEG